MGVCGSYCALRLHWYVRASGQALLRHWQWLLIAALLVPGFPVGSLLAAVARALLIIVSPQLPMPPRLFGIAVVIVVAVLWVLPQRQSILGGKFASYAATLPVSPLAGLVVDLTILLAANILPLLLFAVAMAGEGSLSALSLLGLFAAALAAQFLLLRLDHLPAIFRGAVTGPRWKEALSPALSIQLQILAERKGAVFLRTAAALGIALAADRLIIAFGLDGRSLPVSIVAAAMICLLVSGLYRPLHDAHRHAARFLTTLPLRSNESNGLPPCLCPARRERIRWTVLLPGDAHRQRVCARARCPN